MNFNLSFSGLTREFILKKSIATRFILIGLTVALSACATQTKHRGFIFPENASELLAKSKTQSDIEKNFGSPSTASIYGTKTWIYYSSDENYRGPLPIKYDNRQVMVVQFNDNKTIKNAEIYDDKTLPNATPKIIDETTPVPAAIDLNMFQELIQNVGRFKPAGA
jgi:outer membrane protein assembly factor BamE (lipoprotein component of BamABCDE complex)